MGSCISRIKDDWRDKKEDLLSKISALENAGEHEQAKKLKEELDKADPDNGPLNLQGHYRILH